MCYLKAFIYENCVILELFSLGKSCNHRTFLLEQSCNHRISLHEKDVVIEISFMIKFNHRTFLYGNEKSFNHRIFFVYDIKDP